MFTELIELVRHQGHSSVLAHRASVQGSCISPGWSNGRYLSFQRRAEELRSPITSCRFGAMSACHLTDWFLWPPFDEFSGLIELVRAKGQHLTPARAARACRGPARCGPAISPGSLYGRRLSLQRPHEGSAHRSPRVNSAQIGARPHRPDPPTPRLATLRLALWAEVGMVGAYDERRGPIQSDMRVHAPRARFSLRLFILIHTP